MIENSVGLEAEFLLRNDKGELVMPGDHGIPTDDFLLLGEVRGKPGITREETVANFLKEFYRISFLAEKKGLALDIATGWAKLEPKFYTSVVRKIEEKAVPKCENIYGTDLLDYSDSVVDGGKLVAHKVSVGLHVHFASVVQAKRDIVTKRYDAVKLPLALAGATAALDLFAERGEDKSKLEVSVSRITKPVIRYIVERMDKEILPQFKIEEPLKYRMPGFYETKEGGRFEYRSLPFNQAVLSNIPRITDYAFALLEGL